MIVRDDYSISIQNGKALITFVDDIVLEKIHRIVNLTKEKVIYNTETRNAKTQASIVGKTLELGFISKDISANDILAIEYLGLDASASSSVAITANSTDFATESKQDSQVTELIAIKNKIIATPATEAKQDSQVTQLTNLNNKFESNNFNTPISNTQKNLLTTDRDFLLVVAMGLVSGWSLVLKSGRDPDIDTGSVPEDIWNGGGVYTGFPTGAPEELQVVSSSASDTGVLTVLYLASPTSTSYQSASVTLQGTTPVNTGITAYRVHSANYSPSVNPSTGFNQGTITVRHRTTISNVFLVMPIGTNQTYMSGYTIPAQCTGYLLKAQWVTSNAGTGSFSDVAFWIRNFNSSPRLRRNSTVSFGGTTKDSISGGLLLPALTDIIPRVNTSSANNAIIVCSYDILLNSNV